jgi:signal transduction histidine kinase
VEVRDDGRGIDPGATPGVGLQSIRERAAEVGGRLELTDADGGGTVMRAQLPLGVR